MQRSVILNLLLVVLVNIPVFVVLALYDSLGSIGPQLLENGIDIKSLGELISAYSITTPVAPLLFGLMADKYSQTLPTVIVLVLLIIGTLFVWFSNFNYWMMFVGRFLIGFSDCWFPLQMRLFTFLFDGFWLTFVMAVCTIISQLGIVVVFALFPHVAEIDVNYALGGGFGLAVLAGIAIVIFDLLNRFYLKIDTRAQGGSEMKLSDLFSFPATYWCLALITVFSMVPYWVLISFGPSFLVERNYTTQEAGYLISGVNLSVLISPFSGWFIDYFGHRGKILIVTMVFQVIGFLFLYFQLYDPAVWISIIAVAFAVFNPVVYASIPLVVSETAIGTAYGIQASMFGLGLLIDPLIAGYLVYYFTWKGVHLFFSISSFLGLVLMVIIEILDRKEGKFRVPISTYKKESYILIADVDNDNELYPLGYKRIEIEYKV